MSNWFASWFDTEYYHQLYNNRDEGEAARFIQHIIHFLNLPKGNKVLDIACGKGRHARAISEQGYDVVGIDLSPNSINEANQMKTDHLSFFVHDMREVFRENEFDAAFNCFTSFGYFDVEEDNYKAANAFVQCLQPGGKLVIDFVNKAFALSNIQSKANETQMRGDLKFEIERRFEAGRYIKNITVCEEEKCMRFQESLQSFVLADFERFFLPLGMDLLETFGNYDLEPYRENDSPRMIMIFQKG